MLRKSEQKTAVKIGNVTLYVDLAKKAMRAGVRGKALDAGRFYAGLSKGEARKLRKRLRCEGFVSIAAQSRVS